MLPAWRTPDSTLRWSLAGTDPQGSLLEGDVDPTRELREVEYLHVTRALDHQRGARGVAHAVPLHDQRLSRL